MAEGTQAGVTPATSNASTVKTTGGVKKYEVLVDCYWNNQLWHAEATAEIPAGLTPPEEYFKKL